MNFFKKFLKGHISFPLTFWVFGFVAYLALGLLKMFIYATFVADDISSVWQPVGMPLIDANEALKAAYNSPILLGVWGFEFIYSVFASIGIWNASNIYKTEEAEETNWPVMAKMVVILSWIYYIFKFLSPKAFL